MRSFDLFDTLVARRCVAPHEVFRMLEQRAGITHLAAARIEAERAIEASPYDLAAIYRQLCARHNLPPETGEHLMQLELAIEAEMLFPIAETCALFQPGDIVVSDMYLPEAFLKKILLETCQLEPAALYLSSNGKRTGAVWPKIARQHAISMHYGDNPVTDIKSAQAAGIEARHVTLAHPTHIETLLATHGFTPLANLVREARLRTHHKLSSHRHLQLLQIQLNFPLLFMATLALVAEATRRGWQRILFSGRDGFLWNALYQTLYPLLEHAPPAVYFYTSRLARMRPSADYIAYFNALRGEGPSAVVDLIGTGWSLTRLIEHARARQTEIFLLHHLDDASLTAHYQAHAPTNSPIAARSLVRRPLVDLDNEVLEELNRAPHPMVTDMRQTPAGFRPILAPPDINPETFEVLHLHHEAFGAAMRLASTLRNGELTQMQQAAAPEFIAAFYTNFRGHAGALSHFRPAKVTEEQAFFAALRH